MNPARRGTPESEAVVSSEDERPWPSSTSFGKHPMKENSVPGLPGGIWATQKRGSFKLSDAARHNTVRDVRLAAVNPVHAAALRGTPSPSTDSAGTLPFTIPLNPTPKSGRSLSHSHGQHEVSKKLSQQAKNHHQNVQPVALPLDLLVEEADTESESELGSGLTQTTSHPPIATLTRANTHSAAYDYHRGSRERLTDHSPPAHPRGMTLESAFAQFSLDRPRKTQWQSHLGWDDVPNVNESRRHSLADIPTRRGSLAGGEPSNLTRVLTMDNAIEDDSPRFTIPNNDQPMTRAQESAAAAMVPAMYRVPFVELNQHERNELKARHEQQQQQQQQHQQQTGAPSSQWAAGGTGRPRKQLYIVSFKCSRVDVFYLLDNTGLQIREGDMVIVEADRGQDLGTVQHARVTPDAARLLKKKYSEEQYKWLMMYSRNKDGGFNPNAQLHGENNAGYGQMFPDAPSTMQGAIPRETYGNLKPKAIKRLANDHEVKMLAEKEGNEAKAKRTCQQKVAHLRLQMEILDAEWQWDFQKLIFYYYADHYINFKDLITELYRIYKTRIWLSAINPASFSQHAMDQPPSGIGPGAVPPYNPYALNSSYTMTYGEDRDPYGAQMPYQIPYDTYQPNWPAIPGVSNSFAPPAFLPGQNYMFYGQNGGSDPSAPPAEDGAPPMGSNTMPPSFANVNNPMDYGAPYERAGNNEQRFPTAYAGGLNPQARPSDAGPGPAPRGHGDPWNPAVHSVPHVGGLGRPAVLPSPIGTARPTSQGADYGLPTDEQRFMATNPEWSQSAFRNVDSGRAPGRPPGFSENAGANGNGDRMGMTNNPMYSTAAGTPRRDKDEGAGRFRPMDRFPMQMPSHTEMRADG